MKRVKKFLSLVLVVVICCSYVVIPTQAASFTPRLSEPSTTSAYWIHTSYGGLNSCIIADGNSVLPNCVGYAWGRAYEILNKQPDLSRNNAGGWFDYNKNKYDNGNGGYPYSTDVSKPKLGAIACWSGHVAVVEEINGNQIVTSESSWGGKRFLTTTRKTTSAVLSENGSVFYGYIYILEDTGSHAHSYLSHYEADHPHRVYSKCSCGDWYYTGGTQYLSSCSECNEPTKIVYPTDGGIYKIASGVGNNMYLAFALSNDNIQIYEDGDGNSDPSWVKSQYYKLTHVGDGWYTIINVGNGLAVDVYDGNSASGTNISQFAPHGGENQLFRFYDAGDGYCYIKSKLGTYVDVQNGDSVNRANVWAHSFNGTNAQKWKLRGHSHTYAYLYEGDHPHRVYNKCSCGDWYYTGENVILDTCKYCNWPEKPSFSSWKDAYLKTVTFTWNATKNTSHYNIWLYTKNAQGEWTKYEHMTYVNSGVTKELPADEYMCVLQSCNSDFFDGSTWLYEESDFYYFTVFEELEKPEFSDWKETYSESETIQFKWDTKNYATHYNIWLETKNAQGKWEKYEHVTYVNSGVTKKLPVGEYRCVLQICNSNFYEGSSWMYKESNYYYFSVVPAHSHTYTAKVTKNATHLEEGEMTYTCACNDSYTEAIAKLPEHTYTAEVTKEATHLEEGEMTYSCACNDSYTEAIAKLPEHTYTAEVTKEATHLAEGEMTYTCACNDSYTEVIAKILEHTYQASKITAPTCKEAGYTTYVCACGDSYKDDFVAEKGHTYNGQLCTSCGLKCSCNCHKSGFMGFIWKITLFFSKLFKN